MALLVLLALAGLAIFGAGIATAYLAGFDAGRAALVKEQTRRLENRERLTRKG